LIGLASLETLQKEAGGSSSSDMTVMLRVIDGKSLSSRLKLSKKLVFLIYSVISFMLYLLSSTVLGEYADPVDVSTLFIV
jgi:hypothetical protein